MAKQPTPAFRIYEQQSAPRAGLAPQASRVDVSSEQSSIGASLLRAGAAVQQYQETDLAIERLAAQRREEEARVTVARRMADVRRQASQAQRDALQNAPDGWRGATDTFAQTFHQLREQSLSDPTINTEEARILLEDQLYIYEQEALDNAAGAEQTARDEWVTDSWHTTIDTQASTLAADPSQYDGILTDTLEQLEGMSGDPNKIRDLVDYAQQNYSVATVQGLINADPRAALRQLEDPEAQGPFQHLGARRAAFINQAQAEINRQESEARARRAEAVATLRDTVNAQNQLLQRNIMPSQVLDPALLSATLGPDVAQNYIANLSGAAAAQGMADMPLSVVAQVAAGAPQPGQSDTQNLVTVEARRAAQQMLTDRREDPGAYALTRGLLPHPDLLPTISQAVQSGDWQAAGVAIRQRSIAAVDLRDRGVVDRVAPLSTPEAQALSQGLSNLPTQARIQFYANLSQNMDREAYTALMGQISNDAPVAAFAGYLWNNPAGRAQNSRGAAERLLRGADLLHGRQADGTGTGSPLIDMPSDAELLAQWRATTGRAYEHMRGTARPGEVGPEDQAFEVYRAYYAGLSEGSDSGDIDEARARRAATLASGGITQWGPSNRETLMPWGMTRSQFESGVRAGFERVGRRGVDIHDYELRAIGGGRYQVFDGNRPARNTTGGNLYITVARPQ